MAAEEYQREKNSLERQLLQTQLRIKSEAEKLTYFEKTGLPNAILISETANRQFLGGDINYLDWVMLVNQALTIHNSYIDTVNLYNESVIEWNYLTSKN